MRFLLIIVVGLMACNSNTQTTSINEKQVLEVISNQQKAWNNGNIENFMQGYWKDTAMQFITQKGNRYGWQNTLEAYKKSYNTAAKMGKLTFSNLKYNALSDQLAQVTGNWQVQQSDTILAGNFSLIFKQFMGEPKIIIDHTW